VGRRPTSKKHAHTAWQGGGAEFVSNDIPERVAIQRRFDVPL
jgi:hypothetical protein